MDEIIYFSIDYVPGLRSKISIGELDETFVDHDADSFQTAANLINNFMNSAESSEK